MNKPEVVIAMYRPKAGKQKDLDLLVKKHFAILRESGLTTQKDSFIGRSSDGTIVEIFEWLNAEAAGKAHDNPAVAEIWGAMDVVCEFGTLAQLPEAKNTFPHFAKF
jgi:hypothetical protein